MQFFAIYSSNASNWDTENHIKIDNSNKKANQTKDYTRIHFKGTDLSISKRKWIYPFANLLNSNIIVVVAGENKSCSWNSLRKTENR